MKKLQVYYGEDEMAVYDQFVRIARSRGQTANQIAKQLVEHYVRNKGDIPYKPFKIIVDGKTLSGLVRGDLNA